MTLEEAKFAILERRFNDLLARFEKVNGGMNDIKDKLIELEQRVALNLIQRKPASGG